MSKYTTDTYRDGGTVNVMEDGRTIYCINHMINDEEYLNAVFPCYPTEGVPISGLPELEKAKRILTEAVPTFRAPNELIAIAHGLTWIETQIFKIKDAENGR